MKLKCKKDIEVAGLTLFKRGQVIEVVSVIRPGRIWTVAHPIQRRQGGILSNATTAVWVPDVEPLED